MSSGFQGNGQGKKQIFECQRYSLLQARLNRRDADDKKIENCSVTQLHRHRIKGLQWSKEKVTVIYKTLRRKLKVEQKNQRTYTE
jgi:hypothetical protein